MSKKNIVIGEETIEVDIARVVAIHVEDIDREMDEVSSQIGHYGELLGAAKREEKKLDGAYRQWRAQVTVTVLKEDPKLAEWKVKANIESREKFLKFKEASAQCDYNVTTLVELVKALVEKSQNLRSRGAWLRRELNAQGMNTPERVSEEVSDRKDGVRAASSRRKKRGK